MTNKEGGLLGHITCFRSGGGSSSVVVGSILASILVTVRTAHTVLSADPGVIVPIFVLTERSTISGHATTTASLSGQSATVPTRLCKDKNYSLFS